MKKHLHLSLSMREEPFFCEMDEGVLGSIEDFVYHREFEPRQIVYFPDDACDHVYWVREGKVKVSRVSGDNREITFRHLLPGDLFGEECLVERARRNDYAEAMEASILCLMRSDDFRRLMREHNELCLLVTKRLARRAREIEHVLSETVFHNVRSRVAAGLLRLYQRESIGDTGTIKVTHQEIASLVGSTRETTTAVLHELREDGIVKMANRRLTVIDPVSLEHLATNA